MSLVILAAVLLITPFLLAILWGAPYLPAHQRKIEIALDGLRLRPGQTLLDLGAGDGKVALTAAQRGLRVIGYEINPWLCLVARVRCARYKGVRIYWRSFWRVTLPAADGVFIFGIGHIMERLSAKLRHELPKGARIASFAWPLPGLPHEHRVGDVFFYTL